MNINRAREVGGSIKQMSYKLDLLKKNKASYDELVKVAKGIVFAFKEYDKAKGFKKRTFITVEKLIR